MNKSSLALLVLTIVGIGALYYFEEQRIHDLETLVSSLQKGAGELTKASDQQREQVRSLQAQNEVFKGESEQLRIQLAAAKTAPKSVPGSDAPAGKASQPGDSNASAAPGKEFMKSLAKMYQDPEMRKSLRSQQAVGVRMIYGDLFKELNLSPEDSELVMEMLADRQMEVSSTAMSSASGIGQPDKASQEKSAEVQKRYAEQLKATLGEEGYAKMQRYEGSIGDRFLLQQFEGQFAAAGAPLEAGQKTQLLEFMQAERANAPAGSNALVNSTNPQQQMSALKSEDAVQQFVTQQEALNQRVRTRAQGILNAGQMATLERVQQQQLELMKGQIRMSREMLGLGK